MLKDLHIKNLILMESCSIELKEGLTILTGETGSGKSAILHGLKLLLGQKLDTSLIRWGEKRGSIQARFEINSKSLLEVLKEAHIEIEDSTLILYREISTEGKSKNCINDRMVSLSLLQKVGSYLVQIVDQTSHHELRSTERQRELLDLFGSLQEDVLLFGSFFEENKQRKNLQKKLEEKEQKKERELTFCLEQQKELSSLQLKEGEEELLFQEYSLFSKSQEILEKKGAEKKDGSLGLHITLEHLFEDIKAGKVEELKLIIKSDVQGSVEALRSTLGKIQSKNVRLNFIHSGIGDITESDVMLAAASNAVVIGFHVGIAGTAKEFAEEEQVDVRFYEIIYEVKTAIEKAMEGLLQPELKEMFVGTAEVRQVFKVSKKGMIAGCAVLKGKIVRNFPCRVLRNGQKVHQGKVESLKRFKDDAREVLEGFECGISVSGFDEILPGDRIEVFEVQEKARKLE